MITGTVRSGCGRASRAFLKNDQYRGRQLEPLFGWLPYPGTLNLRVTGLAACVKSLGEPDLLTEPETPIGPLRWWAARIEWETPHLRSLQCFVVRGAKSQTSYLEIVSRQSLRSLGLADGSVVQVTRVRPWFSVARTASGPISAGSRQ